MTLNMRPSGLVLEKKQILAWYDTTFAYVCLTMFSLGAMVFSLVGIQVARDVQGFARYAWIPYLLLVMSALLVITSIVRLLRRMFVKYRSL